jgi:rhomboid protease GluP
MSNPAPPLLGPLPDGLADEVALLLQAEGIAVGRVDTSDGTFLAVAADQHARALRIVAEEYPEGFAARAEGRPRARRARVYAELQDRWFGSASWVVVLLAIACAAIYVAEELAGGSEDHGVLLRFGASRPAHVRTGEWWRLVTAIFVHIGPRHLLANVATLLVLGPALAAALGAGRFAFVYVVAGALGNAVSYQVMPSDVVSAGASGAILGVLGALGAHRLRFAASARYRGWQVVAAVLAYLAIAVGAAPGVDTMAHVGGLAAGFALGLLIPPPSRTPSAADRRVSLACGVAALVLVGAAFAAQIVTAIRTS